MTQSQFMYELMTELDGLPDERKYIVMNEYTQYFTEQTENGLSEEGIISSLGSPKEIAQSYKSGSPIRLAGVASVDLSSGESTKTPLSVFKFILLIPAAAVYLPVMTALGLAVLLISLLLCAASVCLTVFSFTVASLQTGFIFLGIGGIFFAFAFVMFCVVIFKGALRLVFFFPKLMGRVLRNESKAGKSV